VITFQEHKETGYAMRTWDNARLSDLTIAFAINFNTPGEILTRKAAYGKYHGVELLELLEFPEQPVLTTLLEMRRRQATCINIAGNGIYSLSKLIDQITADQLMFNFVKKLAMNCMWSFSIRSGGQTGVDEAALKAGDKLGLETICLAPKHWMFRDINGRDIIGQEALFLKRFGEKYDATDIL
jgi:hypothetical protein